MLLQLRDFIARERLVSTQQLARMFHMDLSALQPMLDRWVVKGVIESQEKSGCHTPCKGCKTNAPVYYRYVGTKQD